MDILCVFFCLVFAMPLYTSVYVPCGHLLGKGWPLGSRLWCLTLSLLLFHWYPGSGVVFLLLLPLSAGPSLEHYRTEYLQGASEAWLKTGKSDLKMDKNIPQLYLVVAGQPSLEGLQGWRCDDTLW